ncbi:hypothetical protein [Deinococcus alpinitundrae]|uniref:hypothetical protein n=1 Tax=Deinococcus alpinitundrae TaxID=468913 RepID=UPI00137B23F0|nr:hypothetical protein [Deinococcus alpinitundrae]
MKNNCLAAIVLSLLLSACAPQITHTSPPVVVPASVPAPPSGPQIADSDLVSVVLDGATALITIKPGMALAVVRLRLADGSYSVVLNDEAGFLISGTLPTVRAPLLPGVVVEVAPSLGADFLSLIVVPPVTFGGPEQLWRK